jgi:Na+/H+ antiporter NhaD/arsenite permease-like protein
MKKFFLFFSLLIFAQPALCSPIQGAELSLVWGAPFAFILLSLALFPLTAPAVWHHHYGKIVNLFALAFLIPFSFAFSGKTVLHVLSEAILLEYIPFVALLFALFTISGGIRIAGPFRGCPSSNLMLIGSGSVLASLIGTTGASMLLINPLLRANRWRDHKKHTLIFFIFLVSNIGGLLTPLGDPPLFLGFLQGVPFFWTAKNLYYEFLASTVTLLLLYYLIDRFYYKRQSQEHMPQRREHFKIHGKRNLSLLAGVIALVLLSNSWKNPITFSIWGAYKPLNDIVRDLGLILLGVISIRISKEEDRKANEFSWEPILEIAKIFFAIFITVWPVISILHAGEEGALRELVALANDGSKPNNFAYFWLTGLLSSFLDNAPTYLVFFHMAGGDAAYMTTTLKQTLVAISVSSVCMGAMTYIGNAPNFMVRSIAEKRGVKMPSFFGYMLWSFGILGPLFLILSLLL